MIYWLRYYLSIERNVMNQKTYLVLSGIIFIAVALLHAARMAFGWEVSVGGWTVPMWVSWAGLLASGFLAFSSLTLKKDA